MKYANPFQEKTGRLVFLSVISALSKEEEGGAAGSVLTLLATASFFVIML